jgi:hypothetical protein
MTGKASLPGAYLCSADWLAHESRTTNRGGVGHLKTLPCPTFGGRPSEMVDWRKFARGLSDVCLLLRNRVRIFRGGTHTLQRDRPFPRPVLILPFVDRFMLLLSGSNRVSASAMCRRSPKFVTWMRRLLSSAPPL